MSEPPAKRICLDFLPNMPGSRDIAASIATDLQEEVTPELLSACEEAQKSYKSAFVTMWVEMSDAKKADRIEKMMRKLVDRCVKKADSSEPVLQAAYRLLSPDIGIRFQGLLEMLLISRINDPKLVEILDALNQYHICRSAVRDVPCPATPPTIVPPVPGNYVFLSDTARNDKIAAVYVDQLTAALACLTKHFPHITLDNVLSPNPRLTLHQRIQRFGRLLQDSITWTAENADELLACRLPAVCRHLCDLAIVKAVRANLDD